jgi:hypothetical protein
MTLILLELVLSAAIAAAGTPLLVLVLNRHAPGPLSGALFLFLLLLLGTWAAETMTLGLCFYIAVFVLLAAIALRHLGPIMVRTP